MFLVFVFPGQGSQGVGMGSQLFDRYPVVREVFTQADAVLGMPLSRLILEGPAAELNRTVNTQPALLTVETAFARLLAQEGIRPQAVAGHSLGEYSALVASGALAFEDALQLVRLRGRLMEEAVPSGAGGMAAVLGLDAPVVERLCREAGCGVVEPVNYNCPGQVVLAGENEPLARALELAREAGARQCVALNVSGPFHSQLMRPAGEKLAQALTRMVIRDPAVPVVSNATAAWARTARDVSAALLVQMYSPVRWEESVRLLLAFGADAFVEVGPGRVLSGLIKKIDRRARVFNMEDDSFLEKGLAEFKGVI
ncbi:MAG TPA: ACP S-malonyltransferase [Spirochaetia bacterium]|nr:ACP S-malonyltransferase [Spirochaetia bacterium]